MNVSRELEYEVAILPQNKGYDHSYSELTKQDGILLHP
jgi:hypothetical protein